MPQQLPTTEQIISAIASSRSAIGHRRCLVRCGEWLVGIPPPTVATIAANARLPPKWGVTSWRGQKYKIRIYRLPQNIRDKLERNPNFAFALYDPATKQSFSIFPLES